MSELLLSKIQSLLRPAAASPEGAATRPLELTAAPKPKRKDLFLRTNEDRRRDPDAVMGVLARAWRQVEPEGIRREPAELKATVSRTQWPSSKVLDLAAARLEVDRGELERYLRLRPWDREDALKAATFLSEQQKKSNLERGWGVREAGYEPAQVSLDEERLPAQAMLEMSGLLAAGAKVMGVDDFIKAFKAHPGTPGRDGRHGFLLSPARMGGHADARLATELNLRHFVNGYDRFFTQRQVLDGRGNLVPQPESYMDLITASGEPVVFLLPPGYLQMNTAAELRWLVDHPERTKNVTFVMGAFNRQG